MTALAGNAEIRCSNSVGIVLLRRPRRQVKSALHGVHLKAEALSCNPVFLCVTAQAGAAKLGDTRCMDQGVDREIPISGAGQFIDQIADSQKSRGGFALSGEGKRGAQLIHESQLVAVFEEVFHTRPRSRPRNPRRIQPITFKPIHGGMFGAIRSAP